MKPTFVVNILALIILHTTAFAQQSPSFKEILQDYQYNRYENAATKSIEFINSHKNLSKDTLITLLEINAVANYSLSHKDQARASFLRILKINENYSPDPKLISPKIIVFFGNVKKEYLLIKRNLELQKQKEQANEKIVLPRKELISRKKSAALGGMFSVILPGSGHLYLQGTNVKNILITTVSSALIFSSVYSIIRTKSLRNEYLSETNPDLINEKYSHYNNAYKIRNILFTSYAVVWALTQFDFFWFSSDSLFSNSEFAAFVLPDNSTYLSFRIKF